MRRALVAVIVLGMLSAIAPTGARADAATTAGIDAFAPTAEDEGHRYRFRGRLLGTAFSDRLSLGGEIEFAKYETMLAGLPGIQVKSYNLRGVV